MARTFRRPGPIANATVLLLLASAHGPATQANAQEGLSLKVEAEKSGVLIGSGAIRPDLLDDPEFARVLAEQFRSLSPDNELKFDWIEPQQGAFEFAPIDKLVDFAEDHDMVVKGHGLISGGNIPGWLRSLPDSDQVRAAIFHHFDTVMDRYAGRMDRWDVMTEGLSTLGTVGIDPQTGDEVDERGLKKNFLYDTLGPDYHAELFHMAHAADPDALLLINEPLVEYYPAKAQLLYNLVADLVARGVPIHGVGLQTHATLNPPPPGALTDIVDSYHALGLEVHVTEMDAHVYDDVTQAHIYGQVLSEVLAAGVTDISFWGFSDVYTWTWLPGARPHIYDENYEPKPAYYATWNALAQHPCWIDQDPECWAYVSAQNLLHGVEAEWLLPEPSRGLLLGAGAALAVLLARLRWRANR